MTSLMFAATSAATPISVLRQKAKSLSKSDGISLARALNRVAQEEASCNWDAMMDASWAFKPRELAAGSRFITLREQEFCRKTPDGFLCIGSVAPDFSNTDDGVTLKRVSIPGWEATPRPCYFTKLVHQRRGQPCVTIFMERDGKPGRTSVNVPAELAKALDEAKTLTSWCSAMIRITQSAQNMIPESDIAYGHEEAVSRGYLRKNGPDDDGHDYGMRLQRFHGADGSLSWRVSIRLKGSSALHPDLYIPAGQISGDLDSDGVARGIVDAITQDKIFPLTAAAFYLPHQAGYPVTINLPSGPVVGTVCCPWDGREPVHNEGKQGRDIAIYRATKGFRKLFYRVSAIPVFVEEASHLGRFDKDLGPDIDIWHWGESHDLAPGLPASTFKKFNDQRPNARMRFIDHHLVHGFAGLTSALKDPGRSISSNVMLIKNKIYIWSNEEHTDGRQGKETFARAGMFYQFEESGFLNRNARAALLMGCMVRILEVSYIDHPQTEALKENARALQRYYLGLPGGLSRDYEMEPPFTQDTQKSQPLQGGEDVNSDMTPS